ncbi:MAG TPA: hypothetical protein VES88_00245 [Gemmatimonadaceae bacterium]|nr:hypothetical protein [Gemmatimonadaceae bacterium]
MTQTANARQADVASPEAIVAAVYEVLSGRAREERDWDRWRTLYVPNARLIPIENDTEGTPAPRVLSPEQYIASRRPLLAAGDFYEWETGREELRSGSVAHVWSIYEAARTRRRANPPRSEQHPAVERRVAVVDSFGHVGRGQCSRADPS